MHTCHGHRGMHALLGGILLPRVLVQEAWLGAGDAASGSLFSVGVSRTKASGLTEKQLATATGVCAVVKCPGRLLLQHTAMV